MAKFEYSLDIGGYGEAAHIDLDFNIKDGVSPEDFKTVHDAFATLEDVARKYIPAPKKVVEAKNGKRQ